MVPWSALLVVAGVILSRTKRGAIAKHLARFLRAHSAANEVAEQPAWKRCPIARLPDREAQRCVSGTGCGVMEACTHTHSQRVESGSARLAFPSHWRLEVDSCVPAVTNKDRPDKNWVRPVAALIIKHGSKWCRVGTEKAVCEVKPGGRQKNYVSLRGVATRDGAIVHDQ